MSYAAAVVALAAAACAALADPPEAGPVAWSCPTHAVDGIEPLPVVVPPGVVAWSSGLAIHAVRLSDGEPPWGRPGRSSRLIPIQLLLPGLAGGPPDGAMISSLSSLSSLGSRVYVSVITPQHGPSAAAGLLAAIDCSDAAEGRVEWIARAPRGTVAFVGPPRIEGERLLVPVRPEGPIAAIRLAEFDPLDGRFLAIRPFVERPAGEPRRIELAGRRVEVEGPSIECRQVEEPPRSP